MFDDVRAKARAYERRFGLIPRAPKHPYARIPRAVCEEIRLAGIAEAKRLNVPDAFIVQMLLDATLADYRYRDERRAKIAARRHGIVSRRRERRRERQISALARRCRRDLLERVNRAHAEMLATTSRKGPR